MSNAEEGKDASEKKSTGTPWIRQVGGQTRRQHGIPVPLPPVDKNGQMDLYADAQAAFDDLFSWIEADENGVPPGIERPYGWQSEDYVASLRLRATRALDLLDEVTLDKVIEIPKDFVWRTFKKHLFELVAKTSDSKRFEEGERAALIRSFRTARDQFKGFVDDYRGPNMDEIIAKFTVSDEERQAMLDQAMAQRIKEQQPASRTMNVYDDALASFDELASLLARDPSDYPIEGNSPTPRDAYWIRMWKVCGEVTEMLEHLAREGVELPDNYVWNVFRARLEKMFFFERSDAEGQEKGRKAVVAARDQLTKIAAAVEDEKEKARAFAALSVDERLEAWTRQQVPTASGVTHAPSAFGKDHEPWIFDQEDWQAAAIKEGLLQPDIVVPVPPPKKREGVGYGWIWKVPLSILFALAWAWRFPHLLPHFERNIAFFSLWIGSSVSVGGFAATLLNMIWKT